MKKTKALKTLLGMAGAFFAAVSSGVILSCVYTLLLVRAEIKEPATEVSNGFMFVATIATYVSSIIVFLAIVFVALPYVIVSNRLQHFSRNYYLWSGVAIGLFVFIVAEIWQHRLSGPLLRVDFDFLFFAISSMISGAISAWAYWSIARPDK